MKCETSSGNTTIIFTQKKKKRKYYCENPNILKKKKPLQKMFCNTVSKLFQMQKVIKLLGNIFLNKIYCPVRLFIQLWLTGVS